MLFDEEWYERQMEKLKDEYREEGLREGISQGISEGISQNKADVTRAMILKGYPDTEIIEIAGISSEFLASVKEGLTK